MADQALSSSPTRGLSSWWRSFKQKDTSDSTAAPSPHQPQRLQRPQRPRLDRAAASSSAVPGVLKGSGAAGPRPGSPGPVIYNQGKEVSIPPQYFASPIFGTPLEQSLKYASVKISLTDRNGDNFVYGEVPVIIAKCSVYLKQNARDTEGIFRVPGSARRMKVLQDMFNSPPRFGKDLDWDGFNAHDVANVLRRYLNNLPEPIIPLAYYQRFREPLHDYPDITEYINYLAALLRPGAAPAAAAEDPTIEDSATGEPKKPKIARVQEATHVYEKLIFELPPASRQLLVYLLDLLSVFAAAASETRMTAANLASTFQTAILSHPGHQMSPDELQQSRLVIEFLIVNAGAILRKVQELALRDHEHQTAAKAKTEKSLPPTPTIPQTTIPTLKVDDDADDADDDVSTRNTDHSAAETDDTERTVSHDASDASSPTYERSEPIAISTSGGERHMSPPPGHLHIPQLTIQPSPTSRHSVLSDSNQHGRKFRFGGHRRQHSKSLSSAGPTQPSLLSIERKPSVSSHTSEASTSALKRLASPIARMRSSSRNATPEATPSEEKEIDFQALQALQPPPSLLQQQLQPPSRLRESSQGPQPAHEDAEPRRSRWRRSLLVLLPGAGDERGTSPTK